MNLLQIAFLSPLDRNKHRQYYCQEPEYYKALLGDPAGHYRNSVSKAGDRYPECAYS